MQLHERRRFIASEGIGLIRPIHVAEGARVAIEVMLRRLMIAHHLQRETIGRLLRHLVIIRHALSLPVDLARSKPLLD